MDVLVMNVERLCVFIYVGNFIKNIKLVYNVLLDVWEVVSFGKDKGNVGGIFVVKNKNLNKVRGSDVGGSYGFV